MRGLSLDFNYFTVGVKELKILGSTGFQLKAKRQSIVFLLEGLCGNSIGALRPAQGDGKYLNLRSSNIVGGEGSTRASTNRQLSTSHRFADRKSQQSRSS